MRLSLLMVMLGSLASAEVLAEACDVVTRSSSEAVKPVEGHTCYSFGNMPAEAINWSCSNESKEMLSTQKRRVQACQDNSVGRCTASLTQESLANPHATSKAPSRDSLAVPDGAQVVTYYYATAHLQQARKDCESAGGRWQAP